jgi:hypothetical protein
MNWVFAMPGPGRSVNLKVMQRGVMSNGMRNGILLSDFEQRIQQLHAQIDRLIGAT